MPCDVPATQTKYGLTWWHVEADEIKRLVPLLTLLLATKNGLAGSEIERFKRSAQQVRQEPTYWYFNKAGITISSI